MTTLWLYTATFLFQFCCLTAVYLLLFKPTISARITTTRHIPLVLAGILILQLGTAALYRQEVGDIMIQAGAGWHLRHQIDFYFIDGNHQQHPYLPFMIFVFAGANALQELLPFLTFSFFLKIVLAGALLTISWQIRQRAGAEGRVTQLRFLTHPITTTVVFFHGQFDVVLLAFLVAAVAYLHLEKQSKLRQQLIFFLLSTAAFTASILTKTWSIIFLPFFLWEHKRWWQRLSLPILVTVGVIADVFVYTRIVDGSRIRAVLPAALKAGGPVGEWGISLLLSPWQHQLAQYNLPIFAVLSGLLLIPVLLSKATLWQKCLLTILAVYVVIPNWGVQYLFWCLPFVYLAGQAQTKLFKSFSLLATLSLVLNYVNVIWGTAVIPLLPVHLIGLVLWAVCGVWYWQLLWCSLGKSQKFVLQKSFSSV